MEECIFICDQDVSIREACQYILEKEGYFTVGCATMGEFMRAFSHIQPSLILLDFCEPDPTMAMQIIKFLHNQSKPISIILFSTSHEIASIASDYQINTWISKPFDFHDFLTLVVEDLAGLNASK